MNIKNKYIFPEEVRQLIQNLKLKKYFGVIKLVDMIYNKGIKINESYNKLNTPKTLRSFQRNIKSESNRLITFQDLRRAYIFDHPQLLKKKDNIRKPISARLRWIILCRDNFKCKACGISSIDSVLHIDHIYPISLGGETIDENLRCLCAECNMGKSNKLLEINTLKTKQNTNLYKGVKP